MRVVDETFGEFSLLLGFFMSFWRRKKLKEKQKRKGILLFLVLDLEKEAGSVGELESEEESRAPLSTFKLLNSCFLLIQLVFILKVSRFSYVV